MNNDLISREALLEDMCRACSIQGVCENVPCKTRERITNAPAVDAEPVRHAYWIKMVWSDSGEKAGYKRSECGRGAKRKYPYCHCGAKMDGGAE